MIRVVAAFIFRAFSRCNRFSKRPETTDKLCVTANFRAPSAPLFVPSDANMAGLVIGRALHVSLIFSPRNRPQIAKSIIRPHTVDVINLIGPFAVNNRPNDALGAEIAPKNGARPVAVRQRRESLFSGVLGVPCTAAMLNAMRRSSTEKISGPREPIQFPSIGVIAEQLSQQFRRDILAHSIRSDSAAPDSDQRRRAPVCVNSKLL